MRPPGTETGRYKDENRAPNGEIGTYMEPKSPNDSEFCCNGSGRGIS